MPKACLFSRSSGHGCSFPVHCHRKIHHCKSEALTIYFCIESSSKGGTKQWTSSIQSPGLSNNRKKKCNSKPKRAQKVQIEELLEISPEPEFMESTAWSHSCSCATPWTATPSLLEIFFFSLSFNKDSKEVNLNSFKLEKADISDSIISEAIFKKRRLLQSKVVCFRNVSSWTFPRWRWLTVDRDWNDGWGCVSGEKRRGGLGWRQQNQDLEITENRTDRKLPPPAPLFCTLLAINSSFSPWGLENRQFIFSCWRSHSKNIS